MRILLTGGAGFIGSHVLERLLPAHSITILDDFNDYYDPAIKRRNLKEASAKGKVELVEGDLRDAAVIAKSMAANPEAVIHLAARAGVRASLAAPELYSSVNVAGTLALLEASRKAGVKKFVFASSSSVYGDSPNVPYRETETLAPISPYGATKLLGEQYARAFAGLYPMSVTALRFFTVYGPRQRPDMAIHAFAKKILAGEEIPVFGDGTTRRDYTYVDDTVSGVLAALAKEESFGIYNLGESRTVELRELIAILEKHLGRKAKLKPMPEQPGDVKQTFADVSKARAGLGYNPSVDIDEGVRRFVKWLKA